MGSPEDGEGGVPNEQDELYPEEPGLTNYKNTQIQKCTNTKIHKYKSAQIQKYTNTTYTKKGSSSVMSQIFYQIDLLFNIPSDL